MYTSRRAPKNLMSVGNIVDRVLDSSEGPLFCVRVVGSSGSGGGLLEGNWGTSGHTRANCGIVDNLLGCRGGGNDVLGHVLLDSFYEGRGDFTVDNWLNFFNDFRMDCLLNNGGVGDNRGTCRGDSLIRVFLNDVDFRSVNFTVNNGLYLYNPLRADGLFDDSGADVGLDDRGADGCSTFVEVNARSVTYELVVVIEIGRGVGRSVLRVLESPYFLSVLLRLGVVASLFPFEGVLLVSLGGTIRVERG